MGWRIGGPSPFLTERARTRAPEVLAFAAGGGVAVLVAPDGGLAMASEGSLDLDLDLDLDRVARLASRLGGARRAIAFSLEGACVHAAPVHRGWMLCVASRDPVSPLARAERARRAAHVLALALADAAPPGSSSGSPGSAAPVSLFVRKEP